MRVQHRARIQFQLPNPDVVTVSIVSGGHVVRTLARSDALDAGTHGYWWDGKDDQGRLLKDGSYRPRVQLENVGRTFTLPNPIALDTKRPQITLTGHQKVFSPDGDGQRDLIRIRYRINEPGRALLYINGQRRIRARLIDTATGLLLWRGHLGDRALPAGRYGLVLKAEDAAGNVSAATTPVFVRIRYINLARHRIRARAGRAFKVRVFTDALAFQWQLGRRAGTGHDGAVRLRVGRPGWYRLTVTANGYTDHAVVRVAAR